MRCLTSTKDTPGLQKVETTPFVRLAEQCPKLLGKVEQLMDSKLANWCNEYEKDGTWHVLSIALYRTGP